MHKLSIGLFRQAGFTLTELMISVGIFTTGIAVAYPLLISDMNLYVRNFSINKSNNALRYALQSLKNDIDMAIESPRLMSYTSNNDGTGSLTPLHAVGSGTEDLSAPSSDAIMMWVNRGAAYKLMPVGQSATVNPSVGITIEGAAGSPVPQIGDRLIFASPSPYSSATMADTVMMSNVSISKPGRVIRHVDSQHNGNDPFSLYTILLDLTNPLPTNIPSNISVYIAREVAYVAYPPSTTSGNVVRQLLYCSNTNANYIYPPDPKSPGVITITCKLLTSDLDPTPLLGDRLTSNTSAFNYLFYKSTNPYQLTPNASLNLTNPGQNPPLSINLPIRASDYAQFLGVSNNINGNGTSTGFNVFIRGNPVMGIKNP